MYRLFLFLLFAFLFSNCSKEAPYPTPPDPTATAMLEAIDETALPLSAQPLEWQDESLRFLDAFSDTKVVGMGEATHGTSEFFEAKHRIFQYLVEQHGFRILVMEADFGESLLINEAIQAGDRSAIEALMKEKMHFWTWRTREVQQLLEWMCDYNLGKAAEERVHYVGVDCQYNTFHPAGVLQYLQEYAPGMANTFSPLLSEIQVATKNQFPEYTEADFQSLLNEIDTLSSTLLQEKDALVAASSEADFQLHLQILELCRQSALVVYGYASGNNENLRDPFMAQNTLWWQSHLEERKAVLWAHNAHVAMDINYNAQGFHLRQLLGEDYQVIGFSFSKGHFTAVREGGNLGTQSIEAPPRSGSMNGRFSESSLKNFAVEIEALNQYPEWADFLSQSSLTMLNIGSVYTGEADDYYWRFRRTYFDMLIYFDETTATWLL
jgi:erythromycin esterase